MTKEVTEWCHRVYKLSWLELAPSSNSRALFVKEINKIDPDQELLKHIENRIIVQTRHWRNKSKREKVYGIPRLSQWIKDRRFDDPIEIDIKEAPKEQKFCHCGAETIGPRYSVCAKHLETKEQKHKLTAALNSLELYSPGQSLQELSQKCREYLQKSGASGKLLSKMTSSLKPAKPGNQ